jgi:hypothetical protein
MKKLYLDATHKCTRAVAQLAAAIYQGPLKALHQLKTLAVV